MFCKYYFFQLSFKNVWQFVAEALFHKVFVDTQPIRAADIMFDLYLL